MKETHEIGLVDEGQESEAVDELLFAVVLVRNVVEVLLCFTVVVVLVVMVTGQRRFGLD